jgi:Skp family chaperone for outer membrane proteins
MALPRNTIIAIAAAVIVVAGGIGAYFWLKSPSEDAASTPAATAQDDGPLPDPRVLLISMEQVTQGTTVGQSIIKQMQALGDQARAEMGGEAKALQTEEAAVAKLPAGERVARLEALAPRRAALQMKAAQRDAQLKGAFANARAAMAKEIEPVLREIVTKRGANLVMERRASAIEPDPSLDITTEVVAMLDKRMTSYTVTLPPPPQPQDQAQAQQ